MTEEKSGLEPVYVARHFDDAIEFLNALSPWDEQWQSTGGIYEWLFRGQREANWRLTPSAMRDNAFPEWQLGTSARATPDLLEEQLFAEQVALQRFLSACISSAVPIPEDSQLLRSDELGLRIRGMRMGHTDVDVGWNFPPPLERSLYALGQHHLVPTRLLDWTRLPLVAAYFACVKVAGALALKQDLESDTARCAVFALKGQIAFTRLAEREPRLIRVTAPYDANPNLRAQQGAFTLVVYRRKDEPTGADDPLPRLLPTIEDLIRAWVDRYPDAPPQDSHLMLVKLTLPYSECRRLLYLLSHANVHAGTVFPSYDGAVQSLYEREWHST